MVRLSLGVRWPGQAFPKDPRPACQVPTSTWEEKEDVAGQLGDLTTGQPSNRTWLRLERAAPDKGGLQGSTARKPQKASPTLRLRATHLPGGRLRRARRIREAVLDRDT